MPVTTYFAYTIDAFDFPPGGGVQLAAGYDPNSDRVVLVIDDDDSVLEGDLFQNEDGNDGNQHGTVFDLNGNVLGGGPNVNMYAEEQYNLVGDDGSTITLYRMEYDSNPNSNFGNGILAGYLPSSPLQPGVTYSFTTSNVTPGNDTEYTENEGAICFAAGTFISTPLGDRRVEELCVGDLIITRDQGLQRLRWIGCKRYDWQALAAAPKLLPVYIAKDAFGPELPNRPLSVSPQHKVLVTGAETALYFAQDELLVPAVALLNGTSIKRQGPGFGVTYFHLLFDAHEVVYSNGLPTESFHPGQVGLDTLGDATCEEVYEIFPELRQDAKAFGPTVRQSVTASAGRVLAPSGPLV